MLLTLGISFANLLWAHARVVELKLRGQNGQLEVLRKGARNDQALIVVISFGFVMIGGVAIFAPPSVSSISSLVSGIIFISISVCVLALSVGIRMRPRLVLRAGSKHKGE